MSVSTNDLKRGMTLELDGTLYQIIEFQHVKPGKGGAFVRTKLRNLKTGSPDRPDVQRGGNVGLAIVERKEMQYLYRDGDDFVFMDTTPYDQHGRPAEVVGDAASFLTEGADRASWPSTRAVPSASSSPLRWCSGWRRPTRA